MRFPSEDLGSGGVGSAVASLEGIRNRQEGGLSAQSWIWICKETRTGGLKGRKVISLYLYLDYFLLQWAQNSARSDHEFSTSL